MNQNLWSRNLISGLQQMSLPPLSEETISNLFHYNQILLKWNQKINLTAHRSEEESLEKNFLDCLSLLSLVRETSKTIDIGSGAGFPGLVLKITFPSLKMSLIE